MSNTGNTQQIIDYGAQPNDGTGDPLRTAFIKTDENFSNIWLAGPVGSNIRIANNTIQNDATNGNIIIKPNGVGVIQVNGSIVPDLDQVRDLGTANSRFRSVYFSGDINTTGDITAGNITVTNDLDLSGDVTIEGNLTVNGNTVTVNVANLDISDKMIVIANGSPNPESADGAGITIAGANAVIEYQSDTDSLTFNKTIQAPTVNTSTITNEFPLFIQTNGGNAWQFAGDILRGPEGGSWQSAADTIYLTSPANGYITLESQLNGNTVSELFMEHSFIRFFIDNGIDATWQMCANGCTAFPNYIFPYAAGNAGEVLKIDATGNLYWDTVGAEYGNANVAAYLPTYTGNISADNVTVSSISTGNINNQFPIRIQSSGLTSSWEFAGDILRGPEGGSWQSAADTIYLTSPANGYITLESQFNGNTVSELFMEHSFIKFLVDNGGPEKIWQMNLDGSFSVPGNIIPQGNSTASLGNATNQWAELWVSGNTIYIDSVPLSISGNVLTVNGEAVLSNDSDSSITTTGNITASNFFGNIDAANNVNAFDITASGIITAGNISLTGNVISGPDANITFEAGEYSMTFDTAGDLTVAGNINFGGDPSAAPSLNDFASITSAANFAVVIDSADSAPAWSFETGDGALGEFDESPVLRTPAGNGSVIYNETQLAMLAGNIDAGERSSVRLEDGGVALLGTTSLDGELSTIIMEVNTGGVGIRALGDAAPRLSVVGNITGGNINTGGQISATGNVIANNVSTGNVVATRVQNDGNLEIRSNVAGTLRIWTFDTLGDLNLPFGGNISGSGLITANRVSTTGNVTAGGDVTGGILISTNSIGDEGGEIQLAASANATITNGVIIDSYNDIVRIFEGGGSARGVQVDLAKAPAGVGGELLWKVSDLVDAGEFVILDNLKATVPTDGNRGLSIAAVSGSFTANIGAWYGGSGGVGGDSVNNLSVTTTESGSLFGWNFVAEGNTAQYTIYDKTNNRMYRVTLMIGPAYLDNFISIERLA
jgi:hypothetical protein